MKAVFGDGKVAGFNLLHIAAHGCGNIPARREKILGEGGRAIAGDAERVLYDQDLAVGNGAGADNWDVQRLGDAFRQRHRHTFQHQQLGAGLFQRQCIGQQLLRAGRIATLNFIAAEYIHRL